VTTATITRWPWRFSRNRATGRMSVPCFGPGGWSRSFRGRRWGPWSPRGLRGRPDFSSSRPMTETPVGEKEKFKY